MTVEELRDRLREDGFSGRVVTAWQAGLFEAGVRFEDGGEFLFQSLNTEDACRMLLAFVRLVGVSPPSMPRTALQDLVGDPVAAELVSKILRGLTSADVAGAPVRKKEPPPPLPPPSRPAPGNVRVNDATKRPRPAEVAP